MDDAIAGIEHWVGNGRRTSVLRYWFPCGYGGATIGSQNSQ